MINIDSKTLKKEEERAKLCIEKASLVHHYQPSKLKTAHSVFEKWDGQPNRFFLFTFLKETYCGQKLISPLIYKGSSSLFCSHIKVEMILGPVSRIQTSDQGVEIFYQDISAQERHDLFSQLLHNSMIDIYFPFVHLKHHDHLEITSAKDGWDINDETAELLRLGENLQRQVSINLLLSDGQAEPVIYDPACSTGDFLNEIKKAVPKAITIGQDVSQEMCVRASKLLDHVIHGDSICPGLANKTCDYIFFRFLNAEVVSTALAKQLFNAIIPCLKPSGKAILFGFTPVLIALPYLESLKFQLLQCHASLPEEQTIIQYYILQRNSPN